MNTLSPFFSPPPITKAPAAIFASPFPSVPFSVHAHLKTHKAPTATNRSSNSTIDVIPSSITSPPPSPVHKKVLVPIGLGTEEMEVVIMVDVFRRAGADVTVASVEEKLEVEAFGGTRLVADALISACSHQIFDLVALPGGMPGSARLRDCKILQDITTRQAEGNRFYAAICAAPAVTLLPWGLLKRKQTTCHPAFIDKLPSFWAVKSNLQVSGELTTSRGPGTSFEFAVCLTEQLFGEIKAREVCEATLLHVGAGDSRKDSRKEEFNEVSWSLDHPPQVLIPVANGCEEIEVITIVGILRRAKANVILASVGRSLKILGSSGTTFMADKTIGTAAESTYDLIFLPGGTSAAEQLNKSRILKKLLKEQESSGRMFGALGSSPAILQKQGLIKDKRTTAHPSLDDVVTDARVVIDGKLITSKGLSTATDFALAVVSKLFGHSRARCVAEALVFEYPK